MPPGGPRPPHMGHPSMSESSPSSSGTGTPPVNKTGGQSNTSTLLREHLLRNSYGGREGGSPHDGPGAGAPGYPPQMGRGSGRSSQFSVDEMMKGGEDILDYCI